MKRVSLAIIAIFTGIGIISCGGGGGSEGNNSSSNSSTANSKASYTGAAFQGDLATFTFDGKNLTYHIQGPVFGDVNGTIQLTPIIQGETLVYKDKWDDYFYFSGNLGIAEVYPSDSDIATYIVGLKDVKTPNIADIAGTSGKNYIYLGVSPSGEIEGYILTLKPNKTWQLSDGTNGTWTIKGNYIEAYDNNGNRVANVFIKPGKSRAGIVVDLLNGGFGIGLEQKPIKPEELTGTYQTYYYKPPTGNNSKEIECFGTLTVNGTHYVYKETWCSDGEPSQPIEANITINQLCNGKQVNGVACADGFDIFIDPVDGYFIAINPITHEEAFGSSKPWNK